MSTKKKGLLTTSGEWKQHLRPYGKRQFWSKERMAEKRRDIMVRTGRIREYLREHGD